MTGPGPGQKGPRAEAGSARPQALSQLLLGKPALSGRTDRGRRRGEAGLAAATLTLASSASPSPDRVSPSCQNPPRSPPKSHAVHRAAQSQLQWREEEEEEPGPGASGLGAPGRCEHVTGGGRPSPCVAARRRPSRKEGGTKGEASSRVRNVAVTWRRNGFLPLSTPLLDHVTVANSSSPWPRDRLVCLSFVLLVDLSHVTISALFFQWRF